MTEIGARFIVKLRGTDAMWVELIVANVDSAFFRGSRLASSIISVTRTDGDSSEGFKLQLSLSDAFETKLMYERALDKRGKSTKWVVESDPSLGKREPSPITTRQHIYSVHTSNGSSST